jgi:RNA polymerase sigma-70 factor (ECF subfamily)
VAQSILKRIAAGEKSAVQDCLDAYGGLVWSLARRMLRGSEEAEDAVQEIFIDVWKNSARFDETQSSETTFVAMIARRRLIDRLRRGQRQPAVNYLADLPAIEPAGEGDNAHVCVEAREAARAMNSLRPEQRQVLHLSIVQGLSHQEIAEHLQMPLGTVKTHARRGLMQVREALGAPENARNSEGGKTV